MVPSGVSPIGAAQPSGRTREALPQGLLVAAAFLGFVVFWTLVNAIANGDAMDHDMAESYVWGQEFQLGYYKHPPFWAWIAGAWFSLAPHRAWAFALLSAVNAGAGLLGSWFLIGQFAGGNRRIAATLLLLLTPYYSWFAYRYNANTIFLSLWPWTALFLVRSIERKGRSDAILFGIFAALGLLSKYYAVLLLAACALAALFHPKRREYFASQRPYISIAVCAVLFAPHLWWLAQTGFQPVYYFAGETGHSWFFALRQALNLLLESTAYLIPVLLVIWLTRRRSPQGRPAQWREPRMRFMAVLCFVPLFLTLVASIAFRVVLTSGTVISTFSLAPLIVMEFLGVTSANSVARIASWTVLGTSAISVALAPMLGYAHIMHPAGMMRSIPAPDEPLFELAQTATRIWHDRTGSQLRIVGGTLGDPAVPTPYGNPYADAVAFYSADHPSEFIDFDFAHAPWISPERLYRDGMLIVCPSGNGECMKAAGAFAVHEASRVTVTLTHRFWIWQGRPMAFTLTIIPPRAAE